MISLYLTTIVSHFTQVSYVIHVIIHWLHLLLFNEERMSYLAVDVTILCDTCTQYSHHKKCHVNSTNNLQIRWKCSSNRCHSMIASEHAKDSECTASIYDKCGSQKSKTQIMKQDNMASWYLQGMHTEKQSPTHTIRWSNLVTNKEICEFSE